MPAHRESRPGQEVRRRRSHFICLGISAAVTAAALLFYATAFLGERASPLAALLRRAEAATLDTRFLLRGPLPPDPQIVIVEIDQRSQEALGRWPFPRHHFAVLLDVLKEDGARVAVFDVSFSQPDRAAEPLRALREKLKNRRDPKLESELAALEEEFNYDKRLAEAIKRFPAVVLGNYFLYTAADLAGLEKATLTRYDEQLAFHAFPQVRGTESANAGQGIQQLVDGFRDLGLLPRGAEANLPLLNDALSGDTRSSGFFNVYPDADGVIRRMPLAIPYGRSANPAEWDVHPSIDVRALAAYLGLPEQGLTLNLGATGIESIELEKGRFIQPDELGRILINFRGPVRTFPYVSMADAVKRNFRRGTFQNKVVLVGATATGIGDLRTTPFGALDHPGVEIHANVIDNLRNARALARGELQATLDLAAILFFGLGVGTWLAWIPPRRMPAALVFLPVFAAGVQLAFVNGWWLNVVVPAGLTLLPNVFLVALYRVLTEEREKRRLGRAFQQYLSPEVIRRLLENPALVEPRKTEITILFSDIRGYTGIAEQLKADELAALMNRYLTEMTRIIFRHGGTLDKYIGDAVMAFWGAPFDDPAHARNACRAAVEMRERLAELQKEWRAQGTPVLQAGIGLHTGVASVGNMGSELRYGYTALGDAVNLASRIEGLNRIYGPGILISNETREAAEAAAEAARAADRVRFREVDLVRVAGRAQPVALNEVVGARTGSHAGETEEWLSLFTRGRALYKQKDWAGARECFLALLQRWPEDYAASTFLQRCEEFAQHPPAADWDGVFAAESK